MPYSMEMMVFQLHACRYTALAAITVWVYDYLLTVTDELELLWSRNGVIVKGLYLVGRYLPIAGTAIFGGSLLPTWQPHKTNAICHITFTILILCTMIQSIVSMTIFTMRLCTIYVMRPNFRRFLIITLVITLLSYFTFYGVALHYLIPSMAWNPLARTCVIPNFQTWALGAIYLTPVCVQLLRRPSLFRFSIILILLFNEILFRIFMESVIFFSTVLHSIGYHRELAGLRNRSTESVLKRFYIDGAQYYGLVLGLRIGSVCVFFLAPLGLQVLFRYLEYLVSSTLTSRYFLSFRRTILNATQSGLGIEVSITQGTSEHTGSTSWRTKTTPTVDEEDGALETRDHEDGTIRLHMDLIDLETAGDSRSRVGSQSSSAESSVELRNSYAKGNQTGIAGN